MANVLVAQERAHVARVALQALLQRRLHVDLQEEVHAAAQVEAQVHRQCADRREPRRRRRQEVERDRVVRILWVRVERLVDHFLRLELRVAVAETKTRPVRVDDHTRIGDLRRLERRLDAREQAAVHLHRRATAGDLDGRRHAEEVRQRVEQRDRDREPDQRVLPDGKAIHLARIGPVTTEGF